MYAELPSMETFCPSTVSSTSALRLSEVEKCWCCCTALALASFDDRRSDRTKGRDNILSSRRETDVGAVPCCGECSRQCGETQFLLEQPKLFRGDLIGLCYGGLD